MEDFAIYANLISDLGAVAVLAAAVYQMGRAMSSQREVHNELDAKLVEIIQHCVEMKERQINRG